MAIWKKNNLRLLKEEEQLSNSSVFDEGLWQELIMGSELGLTPVEQQRQIKPKEMKQEQKPTALKAGDLDPFTFN
jgi:hypothetical protein